MTSDTTKMYDTSTVVEATAMLLGDHLYVGEWNKVPQYVARLRAQIDLLEAQYISLIGGVE